MQYGSIVNDIQSRATIGQPEPEVGMGATFLSWSDRHAATVTEVKQVGKATQITVQEDKATRTDSNGMSESQNYSFAPDPSGRQAEARQNRRGQWETGEINPETKRWRFTGQRISVGRRSHYYDFSF